MQDRGEMNLGIPGRAGEANVVEVQRVRQSSILLRTQMDCLPSFILINEACETGESSCMGVRDWEDVLYKTEGR